VCVFPEPVAPYANTVATPPRKIVSTTFKSSSLEEEEEEVEEVEEDEEVRLKKTSLYTCSLVEYRSKTASKVYSFAFFVELAGTGFEIRTVLRSARVSKYALSLLLLLLFGVPSRVDDDDDDDAVVSVPDFDEVVVVFFLFFVFFFLFVFFSSSSSSSFEATLLVFGTTTGRVRVATKSVEKTVMMTHRE
tara:strand:- start:314 stop:883 length:570 start_codon:yes stop_codon:yes gene_type:complete